MVKAVDAALRYLLPSIILCQLLVKPANTQVRMYQIEDGPRSIGSNATVVSKMYNGTSGSYVNLFIETSHQPINVGSFYYGNWSDISEDLQFAVPEFPGLILRASADADLTRIVTWNFRNLSENYTQLNLTTVMQTDRGGYINHTTILVSPCPSPVMFYTYGQDAFFKITSQSPAHFNDVGKCSCLEENQVLFNVDGTKATAVATCGDDTEWIGCEQVQCWSGPENITAVQRNYTMTSRNPFSCDFASGFPADTSLYYKLNDMIIPQDYTLKSYDNGKNLTCQVFSYFTVAMKTENVSPQVKVIVFYPPENSTLSDTDLTINVNESKLLTYYFAANPENGSVEVTIKNNQVPSSLFAAVQKYTADTHYRYVYNVTVRSFQDYGFYNICAFTKTPYGTDCATFTINTIDTKHPNKGLSGLTIGLIIGAVVLLLLVIIGICVILRRRKGKHAVNKNALEPTDATNKRENTATEYEVYEVNTGYEEIGPSGGYINVNADTGYESVELHHGSVPAPKTVYATIE